MARNDNIDTPYLNRFKKYYPFEFLSSDNHRNRYELLYKQINDLGMKNSAPGFVLIIRDNLMIDFLIAEGKKTYNIGNGKSTVQLNPPSFYPQGPSYLLEYNIFYDLEHPKPVVLHIWKN
jgi:hypothetical protein